MSTEKNPFPPNVVQYVRQEIERRTQYKMQLEQLKRPPSFKLVEVQRYEADVPRLQDTIQKLTNEIVDVVRVHFPDIQVHPTSQEITIANILAALPTNEDVKRVRVISSRLGAPG